MSPNPDADRLADNARAIAARLAWLSAKPDGPIYDRRSPLHRIVVYKEGSEIRLHFVDPRPQFSRLSAAPTRVSGRMSELDLDDPLFLIAPYTQAFTLPLIWNDDPRRVYTLGFGGGRVPMILHHYFPEVVIESTEIDPAVLKVAESHFGIVYDDRQLVAVEDGRAYLERRPDDIRYDIILNDAFRGTGYGPVQLATVEFYQACKAHLTEGGVVGVNLVESDQLFLEKVDTVRASFEHAYLLVDEDATVVFGTDAEPLAAAERLERAQALQDRHGFTFDFMRKARALKTLAESESYLSRFDSRYGVLTDRDVPGLLEALLEADDPIFFRVGRNAPCPCGSGRKFKSCHGRRG